jgi:glycosyltransferase involved in cell wall biosynthesis
MKVLQAPVNIANQPWLMAQGLRLAGHDAEVWQYVPNKFGYAADRVFEGGADATEYLRRLFEAVDAGFDVVHFHYANSLIPARGFLPWFWDLPVWRALGVTVVFTFHGTDVRLRSHAIADDEFSYYRFADVPCDEDLIAARLAVIRRYASHMTIGSVLNEPYVDEAVYVPKIVDTDTIAATPMVRGRRPVVAHAPSRRATKGTDLVLAGLDRLRADGVEFDLDLIENITNTEAVARMGRADIVVEKLLGGDAGVSSLETMALGRVAVARIRDQVRDQHPAMPVVSADPNTFVDVMRDLLEDPDRRARLGEQGRKYVEQEHSPAVIGRQLETLYTSKPRPGIAAYPDWTVPPKEAATEALRTRLEQARVDRTKLRDEVRRLRAQLNTARDEAGEQ